MKLYNFISENYKQPKAVKEKKQRLDPKCWKGYKKQGTKMKGGVRVNNCVPESLEALARHVKEGVPLPDSLFRYQSEAYFDTFKTAKKLREAGSLPELDWESEEMLGTDIGESVELKGVGRVWLDVPYLEETDTVDEHIKGGLDSYYQLTKAKRLAKADGYDYDELPEYHRGKDQPHKEKYKALAKEVSEDIHMEEADDGIIGEPDNYYDAEQRRQAYNDLQDALAQSSKVEAQYVIDGHCPECPNVEEDEDCYGFGNYGCDEGELTYNGDTVSWKEIKDHDERQAQRQKAKADYPGDEEVIKQAARMMPNMDDPRMIVQQIRTDYPQLGRAKASDLAGKAKQIAFPNETAVYEDENSGEAIVAKMLAKALGDENRWSEHTAQELYAELESEDSELADTISDIGRILYGVRMQESKVMASEAEYQGKDVELNKPKRGGSKKYYVYVKSKKGNVKKISFGDPGLKTKAGNKGRAKSFAARHNCEKKNDKTKAGYWACRLPRYGLVKGGKWW